MILLQDGFQARVTALRMERQLLPHCAGPEEYDELFRDLSPVPMEGWTEPGYPPSLSEHVCFDDRQYNFVRRSRSEILKGRFQGGRIGYLTREDWELYNCLFRKPLPRLSYMQERIFELVRQEGPMNIALMKEFSGLLVKEITPILHRLQSACLLYENQLDNSGDRGWFLFEEEFPEVDWNRYTREEALMKILPRFARRQVFFCMEMAKDFYQLPGKEVRTALKKLVEEGMLLLVQLDGVEGYLTPADLALLEAGSFSPPRREVMLIQRNDFLVKSSEYRLKADFPPRDRKWEPMYYILIDGEIRGVVVGRFKFGPHVVEDVMLELPQEEVLSRKEEILTAVAVRLSPEESPVRRYCGVPQMSLTATSDETIGSER